MIDLRKNQQREESRCTGRQQDPPQSRIHTEELFHQREDQKIDDGIDKDQDIYVDSRIGSPCVIMPY